MAKINWKTLEKLTEHLTDEQLYELVEEIGSMITNKAEWLKIKDLASEVLSVGF
jgi:rubrerythrin